MAIEPRDMALPGLDMHPLRGNRKGSWAVRVSANWRLTFKFPAPMLRTLSMKTTTRPAMKMHNPPHPGEVLRELCLQPLHLSVTEAAVALGVSRKTLSSILSGRSGISPEMAVRLSIALGTTAESWLLQQLQYDLAQAETKRRSLRVKKLAVPHYGDSSAPGS